MSADSIRFTQAEARFEYPDRYDRGTHYNDRHLTDVEIESRAANRFVVHFPDSEEAHCVTLAADEGEYVGSCTCGDFEYRETVCKHLWAVLADPSTAVLDRSATTSKAPKLMTDGGTIATTGTSDSLPTNGNAPTWGDRVEIAVANRFDLQLVDSINFDAVATEETPKLDAGTKIQIKGAQEKIRNGYRNGNQTYTAGRLTFWREELLHLIHDDGLYLVAVYDEDAEPSDPEFLQRTRALTPSEIGEITDGSWYEGHRQSKGYRAKVSWKKVLGRDPDV